MALQVRPHMTKDKKKLKWQLDKDFLGDKGQLFAGGASADLR